MSRKRSSVALAVLALAAVFLAGCSRDKSIDRDKARSEIRSAHSFAAESELFLELVLHGQAPQHYAEEHTGYLQKAVEKSAKELEQARPEPDAKDFVRECQMGLGSLDNELSGIRTAIAGNDKNTLTAAPGRITAIRKSLENANAQL